MCKERKQPFIAVTNRALSRHPYLEQIERIAKRKPKAILLREKDLSEEAYEDLAKEVKMICDRHGIRLICHNYPAVAERLGISTLHLPLAKLREYAACEHEKKLELGCSIHAVEESKEAERLGVSYLVAGHIYATDCKKGLPPRGLSFLREVCSNVTVPVYAIGGIGFADGRIEEVCRNGAKGACIMSEVMKL